MQEMETQALDTTWETSVADALSEIRMRNARNARVGKDGLEIGTVSMTKSAVRNRKMRRLREERS